MDGIVMTNKEHILVLNCQHDLVLFTERSTFLEYIYYNYGKCIRERTIK